MTIVGIDEVGRGCWAGPVVAGAVILSDPLEGLKDSKKLSKKQREELAPTIRAKAYAVGLGWVTPQELDKVGLTHAVGLAMRRALAQIETEYDQIIIDGDYNFMPDNPKAVTMIKADDKVASVSAASILAKVARDQYMSELGENYDMYEFDKHVGYGTTLHLERLKLHGVSDQHRKSFKPIAALLQ